MHRLLVEIAPRDARIAELMAKAEALTRRVAEVEARLCAASSRRIALDFPSRHDSLAGGNHMHHL